jgi:hypothetical protein
MPLLQSMALIKVASVMVTVSRHASLKVKMTRR